MGKVYHLPTSLKVKPKEVNRELVQHLELLLKSARDGSLHSMCSVFCGENEYGNEMVLADPFNDTTTLFLIGMLEKKRFQLLELLCTDD